MVRLIPYSGSESPGPPRRGQMDLMDEIHGYQRMGCTIRQIAEFLNLDVVEVRYTILNWLFRP